MAGHAQDSLSIFDEPQCLIETDSQGKLAANPDILRQVQTLEKKLVVVAIAGLYRTGKSYLMNRLAGKSAGFALGSTLQSKTKGIWIWVCQHPMNVGAYLVLLDTEGLGDAEKGDANHDNWIFTLSTLLSCALVYNFLGIINDDMITKLNFVAEISKKIKTRASDKGGDDSDFDIHFPLFIMALRDFCLELKINGHDVTADQYLEHLLNLGKGKSPEFIASRRCIRKYFKTRKCFTFDRPARTIQLKDLENLEESEIDPEFLKNSRAFTEYVYHEVPIMKLPNGNKVTGQMFASLVESYVSAIREGELPCVESAFVMMANQENGKAIDGATHLYKEQLKAQVHLPTETEEILAKINIQCQKDAIAFFASKVIMDMYGTYQKKLNEELQNIYSALEKENRHISTEKCQNLLSKLETGIKRKLQDKIYTRSGGFQEYTRDLEDLKEAYSAVTGLGVEKERMIDDYINSSAGTSIAILAADEKMTEEDKKVQEMKQEAFRMESQRKRDEEKIKHLQKVAEEEAAVMEETKKRMEENHARELKAMEKQQKDILDMRIKEQERLLREGFKKEAETLKKQIENSQQQFIDNQKQLEAHLEREKKHQLELMEARLREQKMEHDFLTQLEKQKAEYQLQDEKLRLIEESAKAAKAEQEVMMEKMSQMNQENMTAMEKMQQANMKMQAEQLEQQREMERKRMEQDMEKARMEAQQRKEEHERLIEVERGFRLKLEEEQEKREAMERRMMQERRELPEDDGKPNIVEGLMNMFLGPIMKLAGGLFK